MKENRMMKFFTLVFFVAISSGLFAQNQQNHSLQDQYRLNIRQTTERITIDGDLSEAIWDEVEPAGDFWMSYPVDDSRVENKLQTEVRMAYDNQFIYLGVICHGDDDYVIQTLKRDVDLDKGDGFGLVIDPVNEKTNGFAFGVSPAGVQSEILITGKTGRRNERGPSGANVAWDNKWFSEVKNYPDKWTIEIAIPFKSLRFKDDKTTWGINFFRYEAKTNSVHTWSPVPIEFWEMDLGYTGALIWESAPKRVKSNVSLIPYVLGSTYKDQEPETSVIVNDFQAGLDGKVAITSSLNFDFTINPNFSQVEVDEQVTNLTLFDIRLPERRLFFLENSDIFEDFGIPPMRPFFSRKIGLDDEGNAIPILYGARLSGNANSKLRVGLMNLQTRKTDEFLAQNYTAFSFHHQVFSRSIIKGYFHNRSAFDSDTPDYNRNVGAEFQYRSTDGRILGFGGGGKSFSTGITSKEYFYNVGGGYDNRNISVYANLSGVGTNYIADMGFINGQEYYDASRDTVIRIGYNHWYSRAAYTFYSENSNIISHELSGRYILDVDTALELLNSEVEISYTLNQVNTSKFQISLSTSNVNLLFPRSFTGGNLLETGYYVNNICEIEYDTDQRKRFIINAGLMYGSFYGGTRARYLIGLKYRAQPWGNFSVNIEQNYLQFPELNESEKLLLLSPRIEINFSKELFWTTFLQYNTQKDNFNINSRLQWRFLPMSDVYLVYTDNYAVEFWGPKNRGLVLKVNYWLNI